MFEITLPIPPSANMLFPTGLHGRRFPSSAYKQWQKDAGREIKTQPEKLIGPLQAEYSYAFPDRRKRDIANFEKAVTDLLVKAGVMHDDSQIDVMVLRRLPLSCEPRVFIKIEAIGVA
jgi:crossover junction endodeoxyribonuclease RusA